jgi:[ribosomal protein S5]-alanine N-acetyltransferase
MALFRLPNTGPAALVPRGHGLLLRAPQMSDFPQWAQLREHSRAYLTPWEPIWPSDDLTRAGFRRRLRRYAEDIAADRSYPFIIFRESDGVMIGGVTLANVRRGIVQAGTIGYWVGQPHAHRGYMTTALRVLLPSLFGELNLHRIEAACIPSNAASIRVLEKCGFVLVGRERGFANARGAEVEEVVLELREGEVERPRRTRLWPGKSRRGR